MRASSSDGEKATLPSGISKADWLFERRRWQNPRIRHLLGCVRLIDEVMESNYAILHCSPRRLAEIWQRLCRVAETLRDKVSPLLDGDSRIVEVDAARIEIRTRLEDLERRVLSRIDSFSAEPDEERLEELRRFLCAALGKVHAFLLDALGRILAADPRSQHDADYFLARRFVRDVDEAEWLEASVERLDDRLRTLNRERLTGFVHVADAIKGAGRIPSSEQWDEVVSLVNELSEDLTSELKQVVGLRGIRVDELELLEQYSSEIPTLCGVLWGLNIAARESIRVLEREEPVVATEASRKEAALQVVNSVFSDRMVQVMSEINGHLRDLQAFVTLWLRGIGRRRALMVQRIEDE